MGIFDRIADQLGDLIAPDEVQVHVEEAQSRLALGDLDGALDELRIAIQMKPDHARASFLLGIVLGRQGYVEAAEAALAMATTARPDYVEAHAALGEARRRIGRVEAAGDSFRRALELAPADVNLRGEAHRGLGAVHLELGRFDKAVRELRKATALLPDDIESQGLLGRAFAARGDLDAARVCLERAAAAASPDVSSLLALGALYRRLDRATDGEMAYLRAYQVKPSAEARLGLAQARLELGDAAGAESQARAALAEVTSGTAAEVRAEGQVVLARALAAQGNTAAALAAVEAALALAPETSTHAPIVTRADRRGVLDEALHLALRVADVQGAARFAAMLLAARPDDPDALAAEALALLDAGDAAGADARLARAHAGASPLTSERATVETLLAFARARSASADPSSAAAALRRAMQLAPKDSRPRDRLAEVYSGGVEAAPADLYALLRAAHRHLSRVPELADLAPDAARIVELLDRPLQVTVMGEFNAGKSTFVNALLGEDVAPMGIVPTTATINVLKYGAERGARVLYRDDTVRDVPWADVPALLRGVDADEARRIRLVEVRYPLVALERINVVDTPGLNSILPEHEETARAFIAQADAVIWLFTTGQAGTASEKEALLKVRAESKKVLGVLNKIDRASPDDVAEILRHLAEHFGELVEALVPFSAREALEGRADPARLTRSNRAELDRTLEQRFFARAEAIKREAGLRRVGLILDEARARGEKVIAAGGGRQSALESAQAQVRGDQILFDRRFLAEERHRLRAELEELLATGAREVLDFVRPRRWAFGSNQAAPADRDFLVALAEEKLAALGEASRQRVAAESERALLAVRTVEPDASAVDSLRLLDFEVYGRYRAFTRGYLRGGRVDDFFVRVLPKLELSEAAVRRSLELGMLTLDVIDAELLGPLKVWGERYHAALLAQLARLAEADAMRRFEIEERLIRPVESLRRGAASLAGR